MPEKAKRKKDENSPPDGGAGPSTRSRTRVDDEVHGGSDLETISENIVAMNPGDLELDESVEGDLRRSEAQQDLIRNNVQDNRANGVITGDVSAEIRDMRAQQAARFSQLEANLENQEDELTTHQANLTSHQEMYFEYIAGNDNWRSEMISRLEQREEEFRRREEEFHQELQRKDVEFENELQRRQAQFAEEIARRDRSYEVIMESLQEHIARLADFRNDLEDRLINNDERVRQVQVGLENVVQDASNAGRQAARQAATEAAQAAQAQLQPRNDADALNAEEVAAFRREVQFNRDKYFINTLSIKGFNQERLDNSLSNRQKALVILKIDNLESLVDKANMIAVTDRALRITYDESYRMKEALSRIGAVANSLKREDRDLLLKYSQLTPPRFDPHRAALVEKAKAMKQNGEIMSFFFVIVRSRLMLKCNIRNKTASVLSLPDDFMPVAVAAVVDDDNQEGDVVMDEGSQECAICTNRMEGGCWRLGCGHGFDLGCLKLTFALGKIWCPVCRKVPEPVFHPVIAERRPNCTTCEEHTEHMTGLERLDTMRLSPKCGHLHSLSCHYSYAPDKWQEGHWAEETVRAAMTGNWPGCRTCAAGTLEDPRASTNMYELICEYSHRPLAFLRHENELLAVAQPARAQAVPDLVTVVRARTLDPPDERVGRNQRGRQEPNRVSRPGSRSRDNRDGRREIQRRSESARPRDRQNDRGGPRPRRGESVQQRGQNDRDRRGRGDREERQIRNDRSRGRNNVGR